MITIPYFDSIYERCASWYDAISKIGFVQGSRLPIITHNLRITSILLCKPYLKLILGT